MDFIPIDIDECSESSSNCTTDSTCVNTQGSYDCICPEGYSGDGRQDGGGCRGNKNYDRDVPLDLELHMINNNYVWLSIVGIYSQLVCVHLLPKLLANKVHFKTDLHYHAQ